MTFTDTGNNQSTTSEQTFTDTQSSQQNSTNPDQGQQQSAGISESERMNVLQKRVDDSQSFINQLKTENAEMRSTLDAMHDKLSQQSNVDDLLSELRNKNSQTTETPDPVDPNTVAQMVRSELRAEDNMTRVQRELLQAHGDDYNKIVVQEAQKMGMSLEQLNEMATTTPDAVIRLFGKKEQTQSYSAPSGSTVDAQRVAQQVNNETNSLEYFRNLRKTDPRLYSSPEIQKAYREAILKSKNIT